MFFKKKYIISILFLAFVLVLSGCSDTDVKGGMSFGENNTASVSDNGVGTVGVVTTSGGGSTAVNTSYDGPRDEPPRGVDTPRQAAARFLTQATFGPKMSEIESVAERGLDSWLNEQLALSPTYILPQYPPGTYQNGRQAVWWETVVTAPDQLRQKVAHALSQIFVVSDTSAAIQNYGEGMSSYYDILIKNAFGNYRDLLEDVTLHPIMGMYLSMIRNEKPDTERGVRSDENYAREVMQLFSIGLVELNLDGTPRLDQNGNQIPTYSQAEIEGLARVFTGWTFNDCCNFDYEYSWKGDDVINHMRPFEEFHDTDEKAIVGGVRIPAGGSAREDLAMALDTLFNHPNVGPYISRLLIQRLVTSNPSPQYISRVASVFNDNGSGVRGDMAAVVRAILLDDEARFGHVDLPRQFGKLREPLLRITHLWRAFNLGQDREYGYENPENDLAQASLRAPSVFNFYRPDFSPVGVVRSDGLKSPEFQITTESTVNALTNILFEFIQDDGGWRGDFSLDMSEVTALADDHEAMVEYLDLLLMSGWMSEEMKTVLIDYLSNNQLGAEEAARNLVYLIVSSSEYAVQR